MAKEQTLMSGRKNISYKTKYLEAKKKYERLLEMKVGVSPTEEPKLLENPIENNSLEKKSNIESPEAVSKVAPITPEEQPKEIELIQEEFKVEEPKANPDDYEFRCSACKELFNSEGNIVEEGIKCPDCGKVYPNA